MAVGEDVAVDISGLNHSVNAAILKKQIRLQSVETPYEPYGPLVTVLGHGRVPLTKTLTLG